MAYPYRCSKETCKKRRTLRKKLEEYIRKPKCYSCKGTAFRLDTWKKKDHKASKCLCDDRHYPHRLGSKGCANYRGTYTDEELESRYRDYN